MQVTRVGENEVNADIESIKHRSARPTSCVSDAALFGLLINSITTIRVYYIRSDKLY